jgi:hypothetical protein
VTHLAAWTPVIRIGGVAVALAGGSTAHAALADFRVSEVFAGSAAEPNARFVELHVGPGTAANCLFPTTRIEVFDGAGTLLGAVAPFSGTECFPAGSFFLLASPEGAALFGVERDARLDVAIPRSAGQVCLASSQTRYDCARWGPITSAVRFLRNTDDDTASPPIPSGVALARAADTGVAGADFVLQSPTPRQPNDGTIWIPADGGLPDEPDAAAPIPDAALPDARDDFTRPDAPPIPRPDANLGNPDFLSADPGGGAALSCSLSDADPDPVNVIVNVIVIVIGSFRLRLRPRPRHRP